MKMLSWNVNGLRAALRKDFLEWLSGCGADIVCLQETKSLEEQLPKKALSPSGYDFHITPADRKGYSGVAVYYLKKPLRIENGFGKKKFDIEGRVQKLIYSDFSLYNVYFPNGGASPERLAYKLDFYSEFFKLVKKEASNSGNVIVCGDVNTAHKEIDLARPRENSNNSGFLPQEREALTEFFKSGFIDTFREFHDEDGAYSWWDYKTRARERNVGWRLDYFIISPGLREKLRDAFILGDVPGSDHCPVGIDIDV
ncbi:MAG: exodeoxyribonuclease III [Fibrobacterota bacterium]